LYSVRDLAQRDLRGALEQAARLHYQTVEFAGFFGHPARDVKAWLDAFGLTAIGTHTGLAELDQNFESVVRFHHHIGCGLLVVPYAKPETQADCRALAQTLSLYQERLAREGIALAYHNHAHEFAPVEGGPSLWDTLIALPGLQLELDTYWAYVAGEDSVFRMEMLHRENRLPVIHLKDGLQNGTGKPLGMGAAPVEAVYRAALRLGVPILAESETLTPSGMEEARICMDTLQKLEGKMTE
jgi:sugar phosphate isomerase/epimerase